MALHLHDVRERLIFAGVEIIFGELALVKELALLEKPLGALQGADVLCAVGREKLADMGR